MPRYPWESEFYEKHAKLLYQSFERCTGSPLVPLVPGTEKVVEVLFNAPFALVSHGTEEDPVFNFGNNTALKLFELTWEQFTSLPSRKSAEPVNREERRRLLEQVTQQGYIDDYSGVRISSTGQRFLIQQATVWNLIDKEGKYHGQAAVFDQWTFL
jgi:hypothetical protein